MVMGLKHEDMTLSGVVFHGGGLDILCSPVPQAFSCHLSWGWSLVAGQGPDTDADDSSMSDLDDDDGLPDSLLPDKSRGPLSQSHARFLTPHCIAGTVFTIRDISSWHGPEIFPALQLLGTEDTKSIMSKSHLK